MGDNVTFSACFPDLWGVTARVYNEKITAEGYPESYLQTDSIFMEYYTDFTYPTFIDCTIKAFIDEP